MKQATFFILFIFLFENSFAQVSWLQLTDFPGTERDDGSTFTINEKAYCISGLEVGWNCTANGFMFDTSTETWSAMASLPAGEQRQYATAFSYGNFGYLFGGVDCSGNALNDFFQYNPANDTWTTLPNFPGTGRQGMSNFIINNKVYILGGNTTNGTTLNEVWEYDFSNQTWTQKNNAPFAMWRGSAFSFNNTGFMTMGYNGTNYNHHIYTYNPNADTWQILNGIWLPALSYIGTAVAQNKVCLYGGADSLGNVTNTLYIFNPTDTSLTSHAGIPTFGRRGGMAFSANNAFYYTTGVTNSTRVKETWKTTNVVGVEKLEILNDELKIYPNPVSEILNVEWEMMNGKEVKILIYDILGNTVIQHSSFNIPHSTALNVRELKSGIYFLRVGNLTKKFVKE